MLGRLDESFGEAGLRGAPALGIAPTDFVRLGNERVIAVGSAGGDVRMFALAAYRSDGSLDRRFGRKGIVRTRVGTYANAGAAVARPDGRILVSGCASSRPGARDCGDTLVLARYRPDGTLDASFGTSGGHH